MPHKQKKVCRIFLAFCHRPAGGEAELRSLAGPTEPGPGPAPAAAPDKRPGPGPGPAAAAPPAPAPAPSARFLQSLGESLRFHEAHCAFSYRAYVASDDADGDACAAQAVAIAEALRGTDFLLRGVRAGADRGAAGTGRTRFHRAWTAERVETVCCAEAAREWGSLEGEDDAFLAGAGAAAAGAAARAAAGAAPAPAVARPAKRKAPAGPDEVEAAAAAAAAAAEFAEYSVALLPERSRRREGAAGEGAGVVLTPQRAGAAGGARRGKRRDSAKQRNTLVISTKADASLLYSDDVVLEELVRHIRACCPSAPRGEGRAKVYVACLLARAACDGAAGRAVGLDDMLDLTVSVKYSDEADRFMKLARFVLMHVRVNARDLAPARARALAREQIAAAAAVTARIEEFDPLRWQQFIGAAPDGVFARKAVRLFQGTRQGMVRYPWLLERGEAAGEHYLRSAMFSYSSWYTEGGCPDGSVDFAQPGLAGVCACDAFVPQQRSAALTYRAYRAAAEECFPELLSGVGGGFVPAAALFATTHEFVEGRGLAAALRGVFGGHGLPAPAEGAADGHAATLAAVAGDRRHPIWKRDVWVVIADGCPGWEIARLLQALQARGRDGPRAVLFVGSRACAAHAVPDGGWHALDGLRAAGCRWRASARYALAPGALARCLDARADAAPQRGLPAWAVGPRAAPVDVRPGDIVYLRGAGVVNAPHLLHHRVLARVKEVELRSGGGCDVRCVQPHRDIQRAAPLRNAAAAGESTRFFCDTAKASSGAAAVPMLGTAPSRYPARLVESASLALLAADAKTLAAETATAIRLCSGKLRMRPEDAARAGALLDALAGGGR
jgi:hypothetical protein